MALKTCDFVVAVLKEDSPLFLLKDNGLEKSSAISNVNYSHVYETKGNKTLIDILEEKDDSGKQVFEVVFSAQVLDADRSTRALARAYYIPYFSDLYNHVQMYSFLKRR